ncbi:MAG: DUF5984 family protein [Dyadobacter sp.]|uniref:DUF5984 family protein n=1 Tax=Dyadobacter sp. TaxID=1914288 RepID=UPI003266E678
MAFSAFSDLRLINYKLTDIKDIIPLGTVKHPIMNWFALTDGYLYLKLGTKSVYEYASDANAILCDGVKYNSYYLIRFIEDFTEIFQTVGQPLPSQILPEIKNFHAFQRFQNQSIAYLEELRAKYKLNDHDLDEQQQLISWIYSRGLPADHLVGGPNIWFFRYCDQIKIIWRANYQIRPNIFLWLFPNGDYTLNYNFFLREIEIFAKSFFSDMAKRVELAVSIDWGNVAIDKNSLVAEQLFRKDRFYQDLNMLSSNSTTDWSETISLINKMKNQSRFKN